MMGWFRSKPPAPAGAFSQGRMLGTVPLHDMPPTPAPPRSKRHLGAERLEAEAAALGHRLNADQTVAVATDVFWNEDMATCPRGAKVQLLGAGGVASYGVYNGRDPFWVGWAPVPKRRA